MFFAGKLDHFARDADRIKGGAFGELLARDAEGRGTHNGATEVATGNQNIAQAEARYRQATASLQQTQAGQWPTLSTNASAARSSQATTAGRSTATSLSTSLAASWELDLWGRVRRSIEAGDASAAASAADLAATTLSLRAQLATSYGNLRSLDAQRALLEDSVEAYERSLKLTQNRYDAGIAPRTDVLQAQTQLANARADLLTLQRQRVQAEHAIAVLVGKAPVYRKIALGELATLKANTALADAMVKGLADMKADGSYEKILAKWGVAAVPRVATALPTPNWARTSPTCAARGR